MRIIRMTLSLFCCLLLSATAYAAPPVKYSNPNLVGTWATTGYADGRIYEYPHSCVVITSQNGNLLEGTFCWHSSMKVIAAGTVCYDSNDPVSCQTGTVHEYFASTPTCEAISGSINSNQVIMYGNASITSGNTVYDLNRTSVGLYDRESDSINGMSHVSILIKVDGVLDSVSNETRQFKVHSRGTACPMSTAPATITWVGHRR